MARVVEDVGAHREAGIDHLGEPEHEHHAHAAHILPPVGNDGKEGVDVNPDDIKDEQAHKQLVQRHLAAEAVHLAPLLLFHGCGYHRPRDGTQRTVGNLDHVGYVRGYGIDSCQRQSGFRPEEERVDERNVAGQHHGSHEERIAHYLAPLPPGEEMSVDAEGDAPQRQEVEQVEHHGQPIAAAKQPHEDIERNEPEAIQQVGCEGEEPDAHLVYQLGHRDAKQHRRIGLEHCHIQRNERQHRHHVEVVGQQRRLLAIEGQQRLPEYQERQREKHKARQRQQHAQPKDAVVVPAVLEIGEEPDNRRVGTQLRQRREQHRRIHQHARQPDLLRLQVARHDEKLHKEPYRHPQIVGKGSSDALSCYNSHSFSLLCSSAPAPSHPLR